jgi:GNAT superfamily N-acetyltransferase
MIRLAKTRADFALCAEINNAVNPDRPVALSRRRPSRGGRREGAGAWVRIDVGSRPRRRRRILALLGAPWLRGSQSGRRCAARDRTGRRRRRAGIVELREEHLRGTYAVAAERVPEMALPQHAEVRPFDEWLPEEDRNSPVAFVVLDGDEVVGCARLYAVSALPQRLENGFTGVRRSHATALKRADLMGRGERLPRARHIVGRGQRGDARGDRAAWVLALRQCVTDDDCEVWLGVRRAVLPNERAHTVVRRDLRGHGLAAALKEREILWAAPNGVRTLVTYTQTGHENMQAVNARLGYVTTAVTIAFRRSLPL